ncbi:MAG: PAS domain S-box protein [Candidatus Acidiferrales bacterium]
MKWKIERHLIRWGFAAAAIILLLVGWESYRNTKRFAEAAEWREHTYEVLRTLDDTLARLVDAETGQRGYLLTGDEVYLQPYREAIKNLDQVTRRLRDLTADNPNQQARIQAMEPLIEKKLGVLQRTIDLRRKESFAAANKLVLEGSGKQSMDQIRVLVSEMANEEKDLLRLRTQRTNESMARSARTIAGGTLLSISLLVLCFALLSRELSERKRAQEALAKSEKWFSTTLSSIGDAVIATDMNGAITFMNSVAQSLTGWGFQEAHGKSMDLVFDIVNKETRRPVENPVKKVFREGKVVGLADHTILRAKNGNEIDIEDSAAPILTSSGEGLGVVLVFRDITELKQTREELDKYFSLSIDMLCIASTDGYFKRLNPAWQKVLGYSIEELLAKPYLDFIHPEDRQATIQQAEKQGHGFEVISFENRYLCKDGSYKWLSWSASPVVDQGLIYAVARDVTQLKQSERALRLSEERYRLLFESNPHPVWVYDLETLAILDVNAAAIRNYGYSREEFLNLTIKDIRPPEDIPAVLNSVAKSSSEFEENRIWRHRKKAGTLFYVDVTSHPLAYAGKNARLVVATDITKRKQAEEALRLSEERFRLLVSGVRDYAIFMLDPDGRVASWNVGAERFKGYQENEILGQSFTRFHTPEDIAQNKPAEKLRVAAAVGRSEDEGWRIRKDGSRFWASVVITALRDERGKLIGFSKITRDMTERKKIEETLHASEERFRKVAETAHDAIISADSHGKIVYVNRAAEQIFAHSSDELIGQPLALLMPERFRSSHLQGFERYLKTGEAHVIGKTVELAGRRKDGTEFPLQLSLSSWKTGEGTFFTGILSDITKRKQVEEDLLRAKEEAERSNKFKDQFLSTMSHELRTPLNAVLGFSDLLSEEQYGPLNDRQRRYVNHIHTGGAHLLRLINDILDLSKIEAGRLQLALENVLVSSCFAEVVDTLRPLADRKSQTLALRPSPDLSVRADATRFKQILMNLIGNAIKFTPEGGTIELVVQELGELARVEVRDSGPGIPLEEQERIFEAFHRLGRSDKTSEGTGLGLAITRRLVELHGGKLGIESQPGSGSNFYFTLPTTPTVQAQETRNSVPSTQLGQSQRVLVVEDDPTAAHLIQSHLVSAGYDVILCDQPSHVVETAARIQPGAITMDIIMKPVNGWELLSGLKSDPRTSKIPVIVITIVDQPSTGALLGADEYIVKPVEKLTLLAAVERCMNRRGRAGQARPILVVEDDTPTREFIAELLGSNGYAVEIAADGAEARTKVADCIPELVILDLILPGSSGLQLLSEWRIDSRTAELPVFVLTSKDLTAAERDYIRTNAGALFHKQERWQESLIRELQRVLPPMLTERL